MSYIYPFGGSQIHRDAFSVVSQIHAMCVRVWVFQDHLICLLIFPWINDDVRIVFVFLFQSNRAINGHP